MSLIGLSTGTTGKESNVDRAVHDMRITPEMKHAWEDDPDTVAAIQAAAVKIQGLTFV